MAANSNPNDGSNVTLVPDPVKLMVLLYWDAHSLVDQLSTQTLLKLLPKLHEWVEQDRQLGLEPPDGVEGRSLVGRTPPDSPSSETAIEPLALVVEDDATAVDSALETLTSLGHRFHIARSQEEARKLLKAHDYTYVLLDLEIPARSEHGIARIQNGENLLEEIVGAKGDGVLPVIIMTSHKAETPDLASETMRLAASLTKKGATDFITKPFPTAGRTLDRVIRKNLPKKEVADKRPAAARPASKPKPFQGGELVFHADRVELCGVKICGNGESGMIRRILDKLKQQNDRGRFVAYCGVALAEEMDCDSGENGVAGAVREFRQKVAGRLMEEANIQCGPRDVIESGGRGYRLSEKITVRDGPDPKTRADDPNRDPNDPKADTKNDPNDPQNATSDGEGTDLNERQVWALAQLRAGAKLRNSELAAKFGCSTSTAKRDLGGLRQAKGIKFVGPARTGYWRLGATKPVESAEIPRGANQTLTPHTVRGRK